MRARVICTRVARTMIVMTFVDHFEPITKYYYYYYLIKKTGPTYFKINFSLNVLATDFRINPRGNEQYRNI